MKQQCFLISLLTWLILMTENSCIRDDPSSSSNSENESTPSGVVSVSVVNLRFFVGLLTVSYILVR